MDRGKAGGDRSALRERQQLRLRKDEGAPTTAPSGLWIFGEKGSSIIAVGSAEVDNARRLFPEAKIVVSNCAADVSFLDPRRAVADQAFKALSDEFARLRASFCKASALSSAPN
jgi:hypothetical protein